MKKRILTALLAAAFVAALIPTALGVAPNLVVAMRINSPWCVVGDRTTQVDDQSDKVYPVAEQNRTLLPVSPVVKAYGGTSEWDAPTGNVVFTLGENRVELRIGSADITVNGAAGRMDVPAKAMNNRTYVPVRAVLEGLGLTVEYESKNQIVVVADGALDKAGLTALPQVKTLVEKTTPKEDPVKFSTQSYALPSGTLNASVITVNMSDARVSVRAALSDGKLNNPKDFKAAAAASGAVAVINANFFNSSADIKDPIGHLMVDGQFQYASSGISSLGITASGEMRYGRPAVFVRVKTADEGTRQEWSAFEVNVLKQFDNQAVLYTPARGSAFSVTFPGAVLTVENGTTTGYRAVSAGESVAIPANGFVLYSSTKVISTNYYQTPEMGRKVALEPYLFKADEEGFTLDGVQTMVSGAPRLVREGAADSTTDSNFTADKFTTGAAPRTAVGSTADGKLLLVNVKAATIQQMRELMLKLSCVDAINLDGGASAAMYYNGGVVAAPGRNLTSTLQVFVAN